MTARRVAIIATVIPIAGLVGLVLLVAGLKGTSNYAENLCFDDLNARPAYGGYSISAEFWPPNFECELRSNRLDPIVVRHRSAALVVLVGWIVCPVLYAASVVVGLRWPVIRPTDRRRPI